MNAAETVIVPTQAEKAELFRALHECPEPLLLPNPWDVGSAKLLTWLGFAALATTSSGFAATLGRLDGAVTREEALAHAAGLTAATRPPGLAGCAVEDFTGQPGSPIYDIGLATDRVAAAAAAATAGLV